MSNTKPSAETRAAEKDEAKAAHRPDREPTAEEEAAAPASAEAGTAEHYKEMSERGADVKGEGRLP